MTRNIDIWGGFECTVARVGGVYRNQIVDTGHWRRDDDLERAASLGVKILRHPVLWETIESSEGQYDWTWVDERLQKARSLSLGIIAGLTHHGGGVPETSLLDTAYPEKLARFAASVAERYPWIDKYTPVNEPLTTARFSCLYGHWYPHCATTGEFLLALFNQARATSLSMAAIRRVNPAALLIQTEDIGRIFATPQMQHQADYENMRRWLSLDLLFGRVTKDHPFYSAFIAAGVSKYHLDELVTNNSPPNVIGLNHYLTSDRYLDHRVGDYSADLSGGNGIDSYADVAAARAHLPKQDVGPRARLQEIWDRYHCPIAITEVHNGSTREEQLRWLAEVWWAANDARSDGVDICGFTIWSLAGAVDWNSLLTRDDGFYEPGPFDIRSNPPRETALAIATRSLAAHGCFDHPALDGAGWWKRTDRYHRKEWCSKNKNKNGAARTIVIMRLRTPLGMAFVSACRRRDLDYTAPQASKNSRAWAVIDTSDGLQMEDPALLIACDKGVPLVRLSDANVFSPSASRRYYESDIPTPDNERGSRAAHAEARASDEAPRCLIARRGPLFAEGWGDRDFKRLLRSGFNGVQCDLSSITYLPDYVDAVLDLLIDEAWGTWHLVNEGSVTTQDRSGADNNIKSAGASKFHAMLETEKGLWLPPLQTRLRQLTAAE